MSNFTVSRPGQANGAGDARALFQQIYGGEVLTAFETKVILKPLHRVRTISGAKSASFPLTWKASTAYHTPGTELTGQVTKHNEKIVTVDELLTSTHFIADIDEAMNHYDIRSIYSTEQGRALALAYDKNVCRVLILSARGAAQISGESASAGGYIQDADGATNAKSFAETLIDAKLALEQKDVEVDSGLNAIVRPALWYLLSKETSVLMNRDVAAGDFANGRLPLIGGVKVLKSNAFVFGTNDASNTDIPTAYRGNWSNSLGVVFTEAAAATVELMGVSMQSDYLVQNQGTIMVARYAVGHSPLLHRCAIEIGTGATAG